MAIEMPIEQDYGRFISGMQDDEVPVADVAAELPDETAEIEELPDGSAVVRMPDTKGPLEDPDFYENLADVISPYDLDNMASRYLNLLEKDKTAREDPIFIKSQYSDRFGFHVLAKNA